MSPTSVAVEFCRYGKNSMEPESGVRCIDLWTSRLTFLGHYRQLQAKRRRTGFERGFPAFETHTDEPLTMWYSSPASSSFDSGLDVWTLTAGTPIPFIRRSYVSVCKLTFVEINTAKSGWRAGGGRVEVRYGCYGGNPPEEPKSADACNTNCGVRECLQRRRLSPVPAERHLASLDRLDYHLFETNTRRRKVSLAQPSATSCITPTTADNRLRARRYAPALPFDAGSVQPDKRLHLLRC
ncbi:hypothetical protein BJ546DRAFT_949473 [Cryomyces antarcticus]